MSTKASRCEGHGCSFGAAVSVVNATPLGSPVLKRTGLVGCLEALVLGSGGVAGHRIMLSEREHGRSEARGWPWITDRSSFCSRRGEVKLYVLCRMTRSGSSSAIAAAALCPSRAAQLIVSHKRSFLGLEVVSLLPYSWSKRRTTSTRASFGSSMGAQRLHARGSGALRHPR